ncbi:RluA family pseudouridine synthase [Candidatus Amesbacteria bacterium]|nr:RluA family pseudouridine synthase [Candidatus Amesbacteria bacterium]
MNDNIIIFEDEAICVIDKPYVVIVNNANTVRSETVQSWFQKKLENRNWKLESEFAQKGGIVHRLDKDTSGVMVLAKTEEAYEKLKLQFLERTTKKTYWALVHGKMSESSGIISAPIDRHPKDSRKFAVSTNLSRTAITEWKVIREFTIFNLQFSLLELSPHTGRTHQLRVHMQHLHHPIVSDPIYGWQKSLSEDLKFCPRLFLHAKSLTFIHPISNQEVIYTSDFPENLQSMLH